jgi:hypothetical protein
VAERIVQRGDDPTARHAPAGERLLPAATCQSVGDRLHQIQVDPAGQFFARVRRQLLASPDPLFLALQSLQTSGAGVLQRVHVVLIPRVPEP